MGEFIRSYFGYCKRLSRGATTVGIMTLSVMTLSVMTLSVMTLSIMTLSIMTLSIMTLSIKGSFVTLSINNIQHVNTVIILSVIMPSAALYKFLYKMLLC